MNSRDGRWLDPPLSLLEYLFQHGWKIVRDTGRDEVAGLCPLHAETHPSFYVNRRKQVFYCHGCGRGGGLPRLIRWMEDPRPAAPPAQHLMEHSYGFYQGQLAHSDQARAYLAGRGIHDAAVIERMRIGYAPGACLRGYLTRLGHPPAALLARGLIDARGRDAFFRCLTFPLPEAANLYGRWLGNGLCRHRFLPGSKGGLYGWAAACDAPRTLLVEGLFDVAALWQAGFPETVAVLGSHLNHPQLVQLTRRHRLVLVCFDADPNGSGHRAAWRVSVQLRHAGVEARRVELPRGHDPASFFAAGATAADFQRRLLEAHP